MEEPTTTNGLETVAAEKSDIQSAEASGQVHDGATNGVPSAPRGVKRPAEEPAEGDGDDDHHHDAAEEDSAVNDVDMTTDEAAAAATATPLSKNQLRKIRRKQRWEEKKKHMKEIRRDKKHDRKERKKAEKEAEIAAAAAEGREPVFSSQPPKAPVQRTQVPVTVILDCQFEKYMLDKELVSLCSQVTRCYSENRNAQFPVHTFVSSYAGAMQSRFETALVNQHQNWKGIHFRDGDFLEVAKEAKELMAGPQGGKTIELLDKSELGDSVSLVQPPQDVKKQKKSTPLPEPEADDVDKSIVYLTADSPYTLDRLEPNTCYVIGGIIDKNREKGLCYKIAREKNVRTAKLPIGEFMVMQSRHILATNHVMDIILKYLELGDWGAAFMKVIPTRKGGKLKDDDTNTEADHAESGGENGGGNREAEAKSGDKDIDMQEEATTQAGQPPEATTAVTESSDNHEPEVEGPTLEDGLEKNALGEKEWSAPPVELEKIPDLETTAEGS